MIGERLKMARRAAGYATAKDAAKALGLPYATYVQHKSIEGRQIDLDKLDRYAAFFGVRIWHFVGPDEAAIWAEFDAIKARRAARCQPVT